MVQERVYIALVPASSYLPKLIRNRPAKLHRHVTPRCVLCDSYFFVVVQISVEVCINSIMAKEFKVNGGMRCSTKAELDQADCEGFIVTSSP